MSPSAPAGHAFIVLFPGDEGARVEAMLISARNPAVSPPVQVLRPPVSGLDFLASSGAAGATLDNWWESSVPPHALAVFVALYEDGLADWIPGTDGCWFVGVPDAGAEADLNRLAEPVFPVLSSNPELVAEQAMQAFGGRGDPKPLFHPSFPYREPPQAWSRQVPGLQPRVRETASAGTPSAVREPEGHAYLVVPPRPPQPISYEVFPASASPYSDTDAAAPPDSPMPTGVVQTAIARAQQGSHRVRRMIQGLSPVPSEPSAGLGLTVNGNRPIVVGFASRKGGVGKTTHAAGVAATIGEALDGLSDTAALVDGNVTNPDSWSLHPPPGAATVRTLISRLSEGRDPPPEEYARTPRLAIYPESRDVDELYTQAEVDLVAEYLKRRHAFLAVDLPNALPSLTSGGPGAVAAAWLVHCDAVVLPFNADPRARQGLLEYIAVMAEDPALADTPILAPYLVSANRAIATDAAVQRDIREVRRQGVEVIEIPDDENALLALLRDLPINRASPRLRRAYLELTDALVAMVIRGRGAH